MRFSPKTDKEIAELGLLPKNEYDYEVVSAEDKTSKGGNEMIAAKLRIYAGENGGTTITDYLMEAMPKKLREFCVQNGLMAEYKSGSLCARDCVGKSGKVGIKIEVDKTGQYADKNAVSYYPTKRGASTDQGAGPGAFPDGISDDDVPF